MEKKFKIVIDDIKEKIVQNVYNPDNALPTEMELSAQYGFSRETIHKAMKELVHEGFIYRIAGKGTFIKKGVAKPADKPPHFFIVFVHKDNEMFKMIRGIENIMEQNNYLFSFFFWNRPHDENATHADDFDSFLFNLAKLNPQGIFCYPRNSIDGYKGYEEILNKKIPLILLDKEFSKCTLNCVVSDNYMGMYRLTQYIIDKGHRKIGYLSLDMMFGDSIVKRREGFFSCLNDNGIPLNKKYIKDNIPDANSIPRLFNDFLRNNPELTAIICANDAVAEKCYPELKNVGLNIPGDISICSFDGYDTGQGLEPPLTAMRQDLFALGENAARAMIDIYRRTINNENVNSFIKYIIPPVLIETDSVKELT